MSRMWHISVPWICLICVQTHELFSAEISNKVEKHPFLDLQHLIGSSFGYAPTPLPTVMESVIWLRLQSQSSHLTSHISHLTCNKFLAKGTEHIVLARPLWISIKCTVRLEEKCLESKLKRGITLHTTAASHLEGYFWSTEMSLLWCDCVQHIHFASPAGFLQILLPPPPAPRPLAVWLDLICE